ncbi:uncharacterized protein LOC141901544 isoform X2 [Tubulanus polymorphus]|uniref:uncharacterized protein LOC141901544 isoform X2 n=1 Tax=Tubulanus polymorphus TaxID=672921 RepID=UPI003DA30CB4
MSGDALGRSPLLTSTPMLGSVASDAMTGDDLGFLSSGRESVFSNDSQFVYEDEDIFSSQIIDREILQSRKKFTLYKISLVTSKARKYVIRRRYADFVYLNKRLRKLFPLFQLHIPPKRYWRNNFSQDFLKQRECGLEKFMQNILAHREVCKSQAVKKFFRIDNPPGPYDDLQTCIMTNIDQEEKIRSLQCMVYNKESEIASLQYEISQLQIGADHHHQSSISMQESQSQIIKQYEEKIKGLEEKATEMEQKYRQAITEMEQSKKQWEDEKQIVKQMRNQEQDIRKAEIESKMKEYDGLLADIRHQIDTQLKTCEFPNVNVNIRGPSFEVTTTEMKPGQLRKLKEDIDYLDVMMRRYNRATLESMEHELVEIKSELAGKDHKNTTLDADLRKCRIDLSHLSLRCQVDVMNKTKKLEDLEQENAKYKEYTVYLEEHYFNSLVIGIKLSQKGMPAGLVTSAQKPRTGSRDQPTAPTFKH